MPLVSKTFDQLLDFTRTTAATFVGSNGLIQTTPASVNLLFATQQFDGPFWGKSGSTVTANTTVAPDGTSTADTLSLAAGVSGAPRLDQRPALTGGTTYTISSYFKASGTNFAFLSMRTNSVNWAGAEFNLSTGTVSRNATSGNVAYVGADISDAGNGWYRCTVTVRPTDTIAANVGFIFFGSSDGTSTFLGGFPVFISAGTESVFIWGAQLEAVPDANLVLGSELNVASVPFTVFRDVSTSTASPTLVNTVIGKAYRLQLNISTNTSTGSSALRIGGGPISASGGVPAGFTGNLILYFVAASAGALTIVGDGPGVNFTVTSVSVKEITGTVGMPTTYTRNNGGRFPARFDYDPVTLAPKGIQIEEQRTNLLLYSEEFDNAAWTKSNTSVTANTTTSPDGTVDADKIIIDNGVASGSSTFISRDITKAASATRYTVSVFAKADGFNSMRLRCRQTSNFANEAFCIFDLAAGTAGTATVNGTFTNASATITLYANGFYRCVLTFTSGTETDLSFRVLPESGTGDGIKGIFAFGAQLEAGAFATSYIPTVASQVTRTADQTSIVAPNFAPWYNQSEGTFVVEASFIGRPASVGNARTAVISDGTANNFISAGLRNNANSSGVYYGQINTGGTSQALLPSSIAADIGDNVTFKSAIAYKVNDIAATANGATVSTDTSATIPAVNTLFIGTIDGAANFLNGHIRSIRYYPTRLSNAQLQALTA
jgi:hypothetical protein